jgi:histidyl-tRNA synthetase
VTDTVEPRLARGMRDLLPEQGSARQRMLDTIRRVYELYGFVPLATPAIEYLDVLSGTGGQEAQAGLFKVKGPDDEALGLRFDLTVPLARVVAQYRDLPRPFRRYQVAPVWRADKPGPGRFREFTQFDLDSVGVESEVADTEIVAGMCDTLSALKVGGYRVRFSSRKVLNLLMPYAGIPPGRGSDVFRVLDKVEKIGLQKLELELTGGYRDESGDFVEGLGLQASQVDRIERFLQVKGERREDVLAQVSDLFASLEGAAAAWPTTPAPCSRPSSPTRPSSARCSAAGVTTTWCCASWASACPPRARRSASIAFWPRWCTWARSACASRRPRCWSPRSTRRCCPTTSR